VEALANIRDAITGYLEAKTVEISGDVDVRAGEHEKGKI